MANENIDISSEKSLILDEVSTRTLNKRFGRPEDYVELYIYDSLGEILFANENFEDYTFPGGINLSKVESSATGELLTSELNMDPIKILQDNGFTSGQYRLSFNILKKKIINSFLKIFVLKEISSSRTELRAITPNIANDNLEPALRRILLEIGSNPFFKDLVLNFGNDQLVTCINISLNKRSKKYEVLFKLYDPLPSSISTTDTFSVAESIVDKINVNVDLGFDPLEEDTINLRGPNFKIDTRLNNSVPSAFKNYNNILEYNSTSSYEQLLNQLENKEVPEIDYTYIKSISSSLEDDNPSYHFENFVHFSSATERLKNFEYKLKLIELYDNQVSEINTITGPTSGSAVVLTDKNNIYKKKESLIKGFDGYERFLYNTSGSVYTWPKQNSIYPYTLYSVTSSNALTWLGEERSQYPNYGGQLLSASLYDRGNIHKISDLLPIHIKENSDNDNFRLFTDMIGQQFDHVWTHIKHITEINDTHHTRGISKDLVYHQLKSLGIEAFDQFENSDLTEYILGKSKSNNTVGGLQVGTFSIGGNNQNFYDTVFNETLVTSSNAGSVPKGEITKNIWKRLYHNAPYLLKTKGTERGLRALMSCYGIPSTLLNVKEYGGSTSDKSTFKTFSYEKSGLALKGDSGTSTGFFIKTPWHTDNTNALSSSAKTVEFRIKPLRSENAYHLFGLSGSNATKDPHLVLTPHTGEDILSTGDSGSYGKIDLYINNSIVKSTEKFPIYNGDFWNIHIGTAGTSGSSANIEFGAYQANFNKNIFKYVTQSLQTEVDRSLTFGDPFISGGADIGGADNAYFGGVPSNGNAAYNTVDTLRYSGSLQEIRYYYGELLSDSTFTKHALEPFMYAGNSISSSFDYVVLRLPLGSNDQQDSSSFHPNIDVNYLESLGGVGSSAVGSGFVIGSYSTTSPPILSNLTNQTFEEVVETHHLPTPDTVGASMTSEKVRLDTGVIDDNILSVVKKSETSALDRQPQDFEDLGVFFSPTTELNEDIIYQLGAFRLDDFIGSPLPSAQSSTNYSDLKDIKDEYFKRVKNRYNYWDYTKIIQYIDHTLFKLVEQFVPMKANLKTGLLIEPHYLERNKFARELPVVDYGTTMTQGSYQTFDFQIDPERQFSLDGSSVITTNILSSVTGSTTGKRQEEGTNITIDMDTYLPRLTQNISQAPIRPFTTTQPAGYVERSSNVLLGNVVNGKKSRIYYRSLDRNGKETDY